MLGRAVFLTVLFTSTCVLIAVSIAIILQLSVLMRLVAPRSERTSDTASWRGALRYVHQAVNSNDLRRFKSVSWLYREPRNFHHCSLTRDSGDACLSKQDIMKEIFKLKVLICLFQIRIKHYFVTKCAFWRESRFKHSDFFISLWRHWYVSRPWWSQFEVCLVQFVWVFWTFSQSY